MLAVQTVLHPTDFSERSGAAFELASAIAREFGARLILLHVAVPPKPDSDRIPPDPARLEEYQRNLQDRLRWLQTGRSVSILTEAVLKEGDPVQEILNTTAECRADLIVMGAHGRTAAGRLLMGSVAEEVARLAPCPVLTVRDPFPRTVPAGGARTAKVVSTA